MAINLLRQPKSLKSDSPFITYETFSKATDEDIRAEWVNGRFLFLCQPNVLINNLLFFHLAADGQYELVATEDNEQVHSQLLWQADQLTPFLVFGEMAGLPPTLIAQFQDGFKKNGNPAG